MKVRLFGHLQLISGQQVLIRFKTRKAGSLLAYLALHLGTAQPRELLTEIIWPDSDPGKARANLRFVLSTLRRDLEPEGVPPGYILRTDHHLIELRAENVTTDLAIFEQCIAAASQASDNTEERISCLQSAVDLYRGDLLLGYYEEWASQRRENLRERYRHALSELTELFEDSGDLQQALRYATAAVAIDPLREESHADVIRLHLAAGSRSAALSQYRKMERTLRQEMKRGPSAAARTLLMQIRSSADPVGPVEPVQPDQPVDAERETTSAEDEDEAEDAALRNGFGASSLAALSAEGEEMEASPLLLPASSSFVVPIPLTRFFDRPELARVVEMIRSRQSRLVTLTGAAGSGKTRLSIEAALRLRDVFGEAVRFLAVTEYHSPDLLANAISDALGLPRRASSDSASASARHEATSATGQQAALLILDGFEAWADRGSSLLVETLQHIPNLACLVTSRIHLRLAGGAVLPVSPLPVPRQADSLSQLQANASFELLLDRIRLVRPDFAPTPANILEMAELCRRLEGLPLSIELAAPWIQVLSPGEILERLERPFALLVSEHTDMPGRHRSIQDAIQSSYDLLTPELQTFFARLSIFEGGFTINFVSTILEEPEAAIYLRQLRECSLVDIVERGHKTHFHLLDVVRTFARDLLSEEERTSLAYRHADFYLQLSFEAESHIGGGAREEWLEELEFRMPNVRRALDWYLQESPVQHVFLAASLWLFWYLRGHIHEGRTRLQQALSLSRDTPGAEMACAKSALGLACLAYAQGDADLGQPLLQEGLSQFRGLRHPAGTASYLSGLARFATFRGDYELADSLLAESLTLWREVSDKAPVGMQDTDSAAMSSAQLFTGKKVFWEIADTIRRRGDIAYSQTDLPLAAERFEESLHLFQQLRDRAGIASAYTGMGVVARTRGEYDKARSLLRQALQIRTQQEDWRGAVTSQRILADIACRQARFSDARILLEECMATLRLRANFQGLTGALTVAGTVALCEGQITEALEHLTRAQDLGAERDDSRRTAYNHCFLSLALLANSEQAAATSAAMDAVRWFYEAGDWGGLAIALEVCAALASEREELEAAAYLLGAAGALRGRLGAPVPPAYATLYEQYLVKARSLLSAEAFLRQQNNGSAAPLTEVVASASLLAP
jgi:predicted ATPase/DNA-binding SARP family transcriptional activator/Tfp pilus assembly protein PilF